MHRRILVMRRFGAMSFGLGYYEDGTWVDHATDVEAKVVGDDGDSDEEGLAWEAVHSWFSCCGSGSGVGEAEHLEEDDPALAAGTRATAAVVRLASS